MTTVKFSSPEEFLEELGKDKDKVSRGIVRLTYLWKPSKLSPNIRHLSVVATAMVEGDILRLEHYCGDVWGTEGQDQPVHEKAESIRKLVEEGCFARGLLVRTGVIEE